MKTYKELLSIYKAHAPDMFLLEMFQENEDEWNKKRLSEEVAKIEQTKKVLKPKANPARKIRNKTYEAYVRERSELYRERDAVFYQLEDSKDRYNTAKAVIETQKKIDDLWYLTDYFDEHGNFPETEEEEMSAADIAKKIHALTTKKYRLKKKSEDTTEVENKIVEFKQKLEEYGR